MPSLFPGELIKLFYYFVVAVDCRVYKVPVTRIEIVSEKIRRRGTKRDRKIKTEASAMQAKF